MTAAVRTRFAPSPTGELHIGGARTALFNYLFARSAGGSFVLRIDDTDPERSRKEYELSLMDDLRWLGLTWDEGPDTGPLLRQSKRTAIYASWLQKLKDCGAAYPCFCSEERLAAMREGQLARGEPPRYDGRCRALSPEEAEQRIAAGEKPCWRLALPDGYSVAFDDAVRGPQSFPAGTIGDFVLQRSDGTPTYLFASAVDDFLMGITHVIRGDEHIPNTARQLAIIDRMGWPRPLFAHIPMVLSGERRKLSKRTGSVPVREYRERGFLPEALDAYLAALSWTPPEGTDPLDLGSLARSFSLEGIVRSSPIHDEDHLLHWQKEAMRRRGVAWVAKELAQMGLPLSRGAEKLLADLLEETPFLPQIRESLEFLSAAPEGVSHEPWMADLAAALPPEPWEAEPLEAFLRGFMKERGLKGREFFHPLRLALTGRDKGAPLPLIFLALGREECERRLS